MGTKESAVGREGFTVQLVESIFVGIGKAFIVKIKVQAFTSQSLLVGTTWTLLVLLAVACLVKVLGVLAPCVEHRNG